MTMERASCVLPTTIWSHVAVVFTASTGTAEFFLNAKSIGSAGGYGHTVNNGTGDFQVGTRQGFLRPPSTATSTKCESGTWRGRQRNWHLASLQSRWAHSRGWLVTGASLANTPMILAMATR